MGDLLGVSVKDLVGVLKERQARIPFEIGAFVALEACEALLPGPASIKLEDVRVADDGTVSVFSPPNSATGPEAARSVVALLAHLLVAAGPGVPPLLVELVERGPSDGRWDLERLRDELEASLVPLNRQAARRVLSRMLRESRREDGGSALSEPPPPDDSAVDAELDALMGVDPSVAEPTADGPTGRHRPTPEVLLAPGHEPRPPAGVDGDSRKRGDMIWSEEEATTLPRRDDSMANTLDRGLSARDVGTAGLAAAPAAPTPFEPPAVGPPPPIGAPPPARPGASVLGEPPPPVARERVEEGDTPGPTPPMMAPRRRSEVDLSGLEELSPKRKSKALLLALLFLVLSAGLLVLVAMFRPDAIDRLMGRETPEIREAARLEEERREEQARLEAEHSARFGDLLVSVSPPQAQILLFVGRGPAEARSLPPGVAHEFVVIADGRVPTRAVVPPDAEWESGDEGPRYELAMQIGEEEMAFEALDLGPTRLPQEMGTPGTEVGTVRIVTNPRGAKVYQLIGFGPNARVESLTTDESRELLVFKEGFVAQRVVVGPSDWRADEGGGRVATVDVVLEERPEE